jgi:hypothetical protein
VGAVAAILTVLIVTPYTHRFNHQSPVQVASTEKTPEIAIQPDYIAPAKAVPVSEPEMEANDQDFFGNSEQAGPEPPSTEASASYNAPMIAVSDDPKTATTVIWMPNQQ